MILNVCYRLKGCGARPPCSERESACGYACMCTRLFADLEKLHVRMQQTWHVRNQEKPRRHRTVFLRQRGILITSQMPASLSEGTEEIILGWWTTGPPCFSLQEAIRAAGAAWHYLLSLGGLHGECTLQRSREWFLCQGIAADNLEDNRRISQRRGATGHPQVFFSIYHLTKLI